MRAITLALSTYTVRVDDKPTVGGRDAAFELQGGIYGVAAFGQAPETGQRDSKTAVRIENQQEPTGHIWSPRWMQGQNPDCYVVAKWFFMGRYIMPPCLVMRLATDD